MSDHRCRAHTSLHLDELAAALGLPGRLIRVWTEPDTDYVHLMLEWDREPDPDNPEPDGFYWVARGGAIDMVPLDRLQT